MNRNTAAVAAVLALLLFAACGDDPVGPDGWTTVLRDGFEFAWKVVDDDLEVSITAPTTGWVMVGFDGEYLYHDANIIIGYVSGGSTSVRDDFGIDSDTHVSDSDLSGGVQNASAVSGEETSGSTTIRFTIPMDSGDTWDNVLTEGATTSILLARGATGADDFDSDASFITNVTVSL